MEVDERTDNYVSQEREQEIKKEEDPGEKLLLSSSVKSSPECLFILMGESVWLDIGWLQRLRSVGKVPPYVIVGGSDNLHNGARSPVIHPPLHTCDKAGSEEDVMMSSSDTEPEETPTPEEEEEKQQLTSQIAQLQDMVRDMKTGFSTAMEELSRIQYGDQVLQEKVDSNKMEYETQLADVVQMVLALKTEFGGLSSQLQMATDSQKALKQRVEYLQFERDILLEELERQGTISEQVRQRYHSGKDRPNGLNRSNESTLSVLLDRARNAFHNHSHVTSDQDSGVNTYRNGDVSSCGEVTPPVVSPMVQSYIANLQNENLEEPAEEDENYDSDSSLTVAANKSLDLSRSLGDRCAEMTQVDSSEEDELGTETHQDQPRIDSQITPESSPAPSYAPSSRPSSAKKTPPHERNTKDMLRTRVAREMLDTERKYCTNLWTILDHFAAPLKQSNILNMRDISVIFPSCLHRIYEHHCAFLQKLEERLCNWRWQGVLGDVLSRFFDMETCDLLRQYQVYVNEFPASLHQIKKSCRNSLRFRKFLRKSQCHPCCEGLDLGAFLLTPIQRIPRYVLLLKQLVKQTDSEHPDFFPIDSCLQKLGNFLTQLNDSIEYSMKVVASDSSPKIKRKLRVGSFRSGSVSSSDTKHISTATRDSGVHSNHDAHSISSASSTGRMFQISVYKDQMSSLPLAPPVGDNGYHSLDGSFVGPVHSSTPYHAPGQYTFSATGQGRDKTFNAPSYESKTLPLKRDKKGKNKIRRPKSGEIVHTSLTSFPHDQVNGNASVSQESRYAADSQVNDVSHQHRVKYSRERPRSAVIESLSGESFQSQSSSGMYSPRRKIPEIREDGIMRNGYSPSRSPRPPSAPRSIYTAAMLGASTALLGASMKSLPDTSQFLAPGPVAPSCGRDNFHISMPRINTEDYGIYGEEEDENELDGSLYRPSTEEALTRKMQMLGVTPRSKSQQNIGQNKGNESPSQQQINQSLAKSLTEERFRGQLDASTALRSGRESQPRPRTERPKSVMNLSAFQSEKEAERIYAKPPRPKSAIVDSPQRKPERKENVWEDSMLDGSILNQSTVSTMSKKELKKRKKQHDKLLLSNSLDSRDKKKGFKNSLKNIFFKKRKHDVSIEGTNPSLNSSKVEELENSVTAPEIQLDSSRLPPREQAPPPDKTIIISTVHVSPAQTDTFEDENGDPCSAV